MRKLAQNIMLALALCLVFAAPGPAGWRGGFGGGGTVSGALTNIDSICDSVGDNCITATANGWEFSEAYSVASGPVTTSGATVMPNGFGMLDPNGDGASVDTSNGQWRNVIAGVVDGKLALDWDHYRAYAGHLVASQEIRCSNDGTCTVGSTSGSIKAIYLKEQSSAPAATSGDAAIYAKTDDTLRANDSTGNDLTLTLSGPPNWTP